MTIEKMPKRGGSYKVEEMDDESLVYRRAAKTAIYLNDTATVIWKLCDGTRTAQEIAAILSQSFPEAADQIRADVKATIDQLVQAGVILLADSKDVGAKPVVEVTEVDT